MTIHPDNLGEKKNVMNTMDHNTIRNITKHNQTMAQQQESLHWRRTIRSPLYLILHPVRSTDTKCLEQFRHIATKACERYKSLIGGLIAHIKHEYAYEVEQKWKNRKYVTVDATGKEYVDFQLYFANIEEALGPELANLCSHIARQVTEEFHGSQQQSDASSNEGIEVANFPDYDFSLQGRIEKMRQKIHAPIPPHEADNVMVIAFILHAIATEPLFREWVVKETIVDEENPNPFDVEEKKRVLETINHICKVTNDLTNGLLATKARMHSELVAYVQECRTFYNTYAAAPF